MKLGTSRKSEIIQYDNLKAGIKQEDVNSQYRSIFTALDADGETKGVLEEKEINNLKNKIKEYARDDKFSKREVGRLLKNLGLKGIKADVFFNFIKEVVGLSENIISTKTENGTTTVKKGKDNKTISSTEYDKEGNITECHEYEYNAYGYNNVEIIKNGDGITKKKIQRDNFGNVTFVGEFNEKGQEIKSTRLNTKGNITGSWEYKYDEQGNMIEQTSFDKNGKKTYSEKNVYDKKGNAIGMTSFQNGNKTSSYKFAYDEKGNMIEQITFDKDGNETDFYKHVYDEKGNTIETTFFDGINKELYSSKSVYDEQGNMIEQTSFDGNGNITSSSKSVYDEKGNEIERTHFDENGNKTDSSKYVYDKMGNMIKEARYDGDGNMTYSEESAYDEKGNKTTTCYDKDNNIQCIREGELIYKPTQSGKNYIEYLSDNIKPYAQKDNDGNFLLSAKSRESFVQTMTRLGITEPEDIEAFKKANPRAAKRSNGGWFRVGMLDVKIPKELAEKIKLEERLEDLAFNPDEEIRKLQGKVK